MHSVTLTLKSGWDPHFLWFNIADGFVVPLAASVQSDDCLHLLHLMFLWSSEVKQLHKNSSPDMSKIWSERQRQDKACHVCRTRSPSGNIWVSCSLEKSILDVCLIGIVLYFAFRMPSIHSTLQSDCFCEVLLQPDSCQAGCF